MVLGLILIGAGLLIGFGGIAFVLVNMGRNFGDLTEEGFFRMLTGHLRAMGVVAFGGLLFIAGVIIAIVNLVERLL